MPRCSRGSRAAIEILERRQLLSAAPLTAGSSASLVIGSGARQMEYLDRGMVVVRNGTTSAYMSWRLLVTDPAGVAFNVYRTTGVATTKLNVSAITATTDFTDTTGNFAVSNSYFVRAVVGGIEQAASPSYILPANTAVSLHFDIPLSRPTGGINPGVPTTANPDPPYPTHTYAYNANDASTGDLDGDGKYEIILKWDPDDSKDSSQDGFTGVTYLDAYKLDGTRLWRINLGQNIRAGAHDTQFIVYDLDGDGRAEVAVRTAPGTIDGQGNPVLLPGDHVTDDYRNVYGRINTGPEYITIFNGATGAAMATTAYLPDRINISSWGDDYGNRGNRFLMAVAYLDGQRPTLMLGRGIFPEQSNGHAVRNEVTAWDWRGGTLSLRWWFRADKNAAAYGLPNVNTNYVGQGNYEMQIADVDGDGKDEIVYGSMTINDNGLPLYSTGLGHGDALAVTDMDPTRAGPEIYMPMESPGVDPRILASNIHRGVDGTVIFSTPAFLGTDGKYPDVGRGNAFDIDPNHAGFETWNSYDSQIYNVDGTILYAKPGNMFTNFGIWWDADPLRELLDGTTISDWVITPHDPNPPTGGRSNDDLDPFVAGTQSAPNAASNNGTKSTPCLVADLLGDWREEAIWRRSDNTALEIFTTAIPATNRMYTLMEDTQYRESVAWQNVGYNQPTATSFFLGATNAAGAFPPIPVPNIYLVQAEPVPSGLAASVVGIGQVNLTWNAVAGASSYFVKRGTLAGGPFTTIAAGVLGPSYSDTTVFGDSTYYYFVTANNPGGESSFSNQASATTPQPYTFQAESGTFGGSTGYGFINSGFHGIGYLDLQQTGDFFELANVYADTGGSERIRFRYSLAGAASVNASAIINGVATPITFTPTGGGSNWSTLELTATMQQRFANTVRLELTSDGPISVDELQVNVTDTLPPVVSSTNFLFATQHAIEIQFDEDVNSSTVNATDLVLHPLPGGSDIVPNGVSYNNLTHTATFTFASFLAEGNYQAVLGNGSVSDLTGHALSGDYGFSVFFLEGDANHDRTVDIKDLMILSPNLGQSILDFSKGDFNYDGVINDVDLGILASRWQTTLSPPVPAAPATTTIATRRTATRVITSIAQGISVISFLVSSRPQSAKYIVAAGPRP